jgi:hypothetical protein
MTSNTQIHDSSPSWIGTDTSIKSGGAKLVLGAQTLIKYRMYHTIFCLKNFTPE